MDDLKHHACPRDDREPQYDGHGIFLTLADVTADLAHAKTLEAGTDESLARLMLRHGRLTDEAILYIGDNYPSVWE